MKVVVDKNTVFVKWFHNTTDEKFEINQNYWVVPKSTLCQLIFDDGVIFSSGKSYCCPTDNFNKSKGRIVSLTKAIKHLPKDVRKLFWSQYKLEIGF